MAYEKHDWATGETITEALLDHMEQGIADAQNATTVPEGSVLAGSGVSVTRDAESGALTVAVAAKGVTAAMLADGVAVSGPKGENGTPGAKGADGKSVKALALTTDAAGKVTGGTMTLSDNSTVAVTVTTATA